MVIIMKEYIYYISYGSNLLTKRFNLYITGGEDKELNIKQVGCLDKTSPKDVIKIQLPYNIYFAKSSSKWGNKGVAFLDVSKSGESYSKGYLITKEQYLEVSKQEGAWYDNEFYLGEYNGYPLYTLTSSTKYTNNRPDEAYLDVIRKGLLETYKDLSIKEINNYLLRRQT